MLSGGGPLPGEAVRSTSIPPHLTSPHHGGVVRLWLLHGKTTLRQTLLYFWPFHLKGSTLLLPVVGSVLLQGTHGTGKTGKMASKKYLSGKTQGIWKFVKHREFCLNTGKRGNFVSSSCKCSDSKSKGYCDSCRKKSIFSPEAG